MKSLIGMCLNWKVLGGLIAVAAGVLIFFPEKAAAAIPLLILAACPLSMVVMMFAMKGMGGMGKKEEGGRPGESPDALREQLAAVRAEERRLEERLASTPQGTPDSGPPASSGQTTPERLA